MTSGLSAYELEREKNIAENRELLRQLNLLGGASKLGLPSKGKKSTAKPVQPRHPIKRKAEEALPTRRSTRSRTNETPEQKKQREAEEQIRKAKEAEERLEEEAREREAKRPRHHDLDLSDLAEDRSRLVETLDILCRNTHPLRLGNGSATSAGEKALKKKLGGLVIRSRAKVTGNRVYSAAFHPEKSKDLIFFGDKHGMLGIWDALAPADEHEDEDGDIIADDEGGRYWQLQLHWPASSRSSISSIKLDPVDSHGLYTSSYDCTIRHLSFSSGISKEVFTTDGVLLQSIDLTPSGHEMWIADARGGLTRLDLRQDKSKAKRYQMTAKEKIGTVSINPVMPHFLLGASNDRILRLWDARKLAVVNSWEAPDSPVAVQGLLRGEYPHQQSVSSAYWDPAGRRIVSTSYDHHLRIWDIDPTKQGGETTLMKPSYALDHNCKTGQWLTVFRAQWCPNMESYPHFTVGDMDHSLKIVSGRGEVLARLRDSERVSAVQAVTCSHGSVEGRIASGNATGRCILWAEPQ